MQGAATIFQPRRRVPIPEITRQPVSTYLRRCDAASRLAAAMPRPVRDGGSGVEATAKEILKGVSRKGGAGESPPVAAQRRAWHGQSRSHGSHLDRVVATSRTGRIGYQTLWGTAY